MVAVGGKAFEGFINFIGSSTVSATGIKTGLAQADLSSAATVAASATNTLMSSANLFSSCICDANETIIRTAGEVIVTIVSPTAFARRPDGETPLELLAQAYYNLDNLPDPLPDPTPGPLEETTENMGTSGVVRTSRISEAGKRLLKLRQTVIVPDVPGEAVTTAKIGPTVSRDRLAKALNKLRKFQSM